MDRIKNAIERAKMEQALTTDRYLRANSTTAPNAPEHGHESNSLLHSASLYTLDKTRFADDRIFAYDGTDLRSSYFDMLRTQVLQMMDTNKWHRLAITSPTPKCGKTIVSINLAFSIARMSDRNPILIDLDLRRPQIASYLGILPTFGVEDILASRCSIGTALIRPDVGNQKLCLLCSNKVVAASEAISSGAMGKLVDDVTSTSNAGIQIFDLPPMLTTDDMLAFLPMVDCVVLVVAVGQSTIHEVEECRRLLSTSNLLGVVLNKAPAFDRSIEPTMRYGYGSITA